jgi:hypothetical protein
VVLAIDFDDELLRDTGEVGEAGADGMPTAELDAGQMAIADQFPADALSAAAIATKLAGSGNAVLFHAPSPNLSPTGERRMKDMICDRNASSSCSYRPAPFP